MAKIKYQNSEMQYYIPRMSIEDMNVSDSIVLASGRVTFWIKFKSKYKFQNFKRNWID